MSGIPPPERMATRAKNAHQHPGKIVEPKTRRTKGQIEQDKELLQIAKEEKEAKKQAGIMRVARLEDKMAAEDNNTDNAHPRHRDDKKREIEPTESDGKTEQPPRKKRAIKDKKGVSDEMEIEPIVQDLPSKVTKGTRGGGGGSKAPATKNVWLTAATDLELEVEEDDIPKETPIKPKRRALPAAKKLESPLTDIEEPTPEEMGRGLKRTYAIAYMTAKTSSDADCGELDPDYELPTDLDPAASGTETGSIDYEMDDAEETPKAKKTATNPASKAVRGKVTGKKSEAVDITGDEMQPEVNEAQKTTKKVTTQATKAKGKAAGKKPEVTEAEVDEEPPKAKKNGTKKAVREAINAHREEPAGKKQEDNSTVTQPSKAAGLIKSWAANVSDVVRPASKTKAPASTRTATSTTLNNPKARTTVTSSAVVISSKIKVKSEPVDNVQGFTDEDETEERQAALSSPIKGKKRLDSSAIIKVEDTPPPKKSGRTIRYKNAHLPAGCTQNNVWRAKVISTYIKYIASQDNIWGIDDAAAAPILQRIWDHIYGTNIPAKVEPSGPIFSIANQHVCEFRSSFGSASLMALNTYFEKEELDTDEDRREFAEAALDQYTFLFGEVTETPNGDIKRRKIFQGPLVLQTFAIYLSATRGAVVVPVIGEPDKPRRALALSAAASERALMLWKDGHISMASQKASPSGSGIIKAVNKESGKTSGRATDFTQGNWAAATAEYFASLEANLRDDAKFDKITHAAKAFMTNNRRGESKSLPIHVDDDDTEAPGGRALLFDDPDSD